MIDTTSFLSPRGCSSNFFTITCSRGCRTLPGYRNSEVMWKLFTLMRAPEQNSVLQNKHCSWVVFAHLGHFQPFFTMSLLSREKQ